MFLILSFHVDYTDFYAVFFGTDLGLSHYFHILAFGLDLYLRAFDEFVVSHANPVDEARFFSFQFSQIIGHFCDLCVQPDELNQSLNRGVHLQNKKN